MSEGFRSGSTRSKAPSSRRRSSLSRPPQDLDRREAADHLLVDDQRHRRIGGADQHVAELQDIGEELQQAQGRALLSLVSGQQVMHFVDDPPSRCLEMRNDGSGHALFQTSTAKRRTVFS